MRGLKVRGVFDTKAAAEDRAKKLSTLDSSFHVFIGQVGYWLPWEPNADKVESEHFQNSQLNDMMEKYQENNVSRDIFYEEQKREKIKAAQEESLKKKKENEELKKKSLDDVEDYDIDPIGEDIEKEVEEKTVEEVEEKKVEDVKDAVNDVIEGVINNSEVSSENKISEDVINKLEGDDPWMQRVQREKEEME